MAVTEPHQPESRSHESPALNNNSSGSGSDSTNEKGPIEAGGTRLSPEPPLFVLPGHAAETDADADEDAGTGAALERPSTAGTDAETYPEGGLRAWLVVLGCWLALVASLGLANTMGTFQSYLVAHQLAHVGEGSVGWVFSIHTFVLFFLGLYIGPIFDKYGPRWIVLAGTVLTCAGLMLFSISTGTFYVYIHIHIAII